MQISQNSFSNPARICYCIVLDICSRILFLLSNEELKKVDGLFAARWNLPTPVEIPRVIADQPGTAICLYCKISGSLYTVRVVCYSGNDQILGTCSLQTPY